jgi:hypothetical protein
VSTAQRRTENSLGPDDITPQHWWRLGGAASNRLSSELSAGAGVDLAGENLTIRASWENDTAKGGHWTSLPSTPSFFRTKARAGRVAARLARVPANQPEHGPTLGASPGTLESGHRRPLRAPLYEVALRALREGGCHRLLNPHTLSLLGVRYPAVGNRVWHRSTPKERMGSGTDLPSASLRSSSTSRQRRFTAGS